ncbi:MAG: glycosyltransferase family 2 protein [Lachnospiraceae bacterium]|nr:glycosyltransferase family 2 protein [Lachnospiraceae bacterium]
MTDPKLSVIFITYNHEKYVEKALRSVLDQKTDFDFEVVIGEDCSTDRTREIMDSVINDYPERTVKKIYRSENTGRPTKNVYDTTMECRGEYLAYLEGDDYWSDDHKLQKQVDFLEAHSEYIACTHSCVMIDEASEEIKDPEILKIGKLYDYSGRFTFEDYKYSGSWPGHYATVVSRNIYPEKKYDYTLLYRAHDFVDDAIILLFLLIQGDIYRMDEVMSAWRYVRKKQGTNWNSLAMERNIIKDDCYLSQTVTKWLAQYRQISDYGKKKAKKDFGTALKMFLKSPGKENRRFLKDMYEGNIRDIVCPEKNTTLVGYSLGYLIGKLTGKE